MHRRYLPIEQLQAWAILNGVKFNNTCVDCRPPSKGEQRGAGVFVTTDFETDHDHEAILVSVPHDLVLSQELVADFAKSDRHLKEVLEAAGEFGRTTRGAILIFLLLQITHSSPELDGGQIGVANPFTDYVAFLPQEFSLPTFYSEEELELLQGTSLADAVDQKLRSLDFEFERLRTSTLEIPWCSKHWWDDETGKLTIEDWKQVDAMYRSRALELPGTGHAMVPIVDMANHASGDQTVAVYETNERKNALLQLRQGMSLKKGQEIFITYGDEKGASEMIFSYGFLEGNVESAKQLFLDLDIPTDDPLRLAKKCVCTEAPGVRLYKDQDRKIGWESKYVWWACVNEEDGIDFRVLQNNDGGKELQVQWKEAELQPAKLAEVLAADPLRDVFQLRAVVIVQERIERQASELEETDDLFGQAIHQSGVEETTWDTIRRLRTAEFDLLVEAYQSLQSEITRLSGLETVQGYLQRSVPDAAQDERANGNEEEDFS